ncbi:MAG: hypothetical protein IT423_17165 [Pirellulaceae bacterium]|nr:hypothetical protein [Pirellulaceae bacterium]
MNVEQAGEQGSKSSPRRSNLLLRLLVYVAIALVVASIYYVPRQLRQHNAILGLSKVNAQTRTQPIVVPFVSEIFGPDYGQEIIEVYFVDPSHTDQDLAMVEGLGSSLQKLELTGSKVTSAGVQKLAGLKNLYTLHLSNTQVDDSGLKALSQLSNLGILSLANTKVTDAGVAELAAIPRLEMLTLDGTAITDEALKTISKMTNLVELTLTYTKVTDVGAEYLKSLTKLERLKIHETQVSLDKMKELSNALPKCAVLVPSALE